MTVLDWHTAWGAVAGPAVAKAVETLAVQPPARILDVGAGLGVAWPALSRCGRVTAIEADAGLVQASQAAANVQGVTQVHGDLLTWLPSQAEPFDLIWAGDVLWHNYFTDPGVVVEQLIGALAPGGRLAVFTANWYASRFLWGHPDLERAVLHANARRWRVPPDGAPTHHEQAAAWLARAGATDVRASLHPLLGHPASVDWAAWLRYLERCVWPDYLAAAEDEEGDTALAREYLRRLVTPGHPDYVPAQPGCLVFQPTLLVSGARPVSVAPPTA